MTSKDIFRNASAAFTSALSPAHQELFSSCNTPNDLLEQVSQLDFVKKSRQRQSKYVDPIQPFVAQLQPYFAAVDVLVQCDPIHAAAVWGGLRVVIQVSNSLSSTLSTDIG